MVKKAKYVTRQMKGFNSLIINVIPTWSEDETLENFKVSFVGFDENYENEKNFRAVNMNPNQLIDFLFTLRGTHIDKFEVNIYSFYHGCNELQLFYNDVIEKLDCYNRFHMEYEWG